MHETRRIKGNVFKNKILVVENISATHKRYYMVNIRNQCNAIQIFLSYNANIKILYLLKYLASTPRAWIDHTSDIGLAPW